MRRRVHPRTLIGFARHALVATVALGIAGTATAQDEKANPFDAFDRAAFEAHARDRGATDAQIEEFATLLADESPKSAADWLLQQVDAAYAAAARIAEDGDESDATEALAALVQATDDPRVRAFASHHLGRLYLDADEPERAAEVLAKALRNDRNLTPIDGESAFFYGSALAEIPMPGEAAATFGDFLSLFPDAPERYRAVAAQRKAELEAQFQNPAHDIADTMKGVKRRLRRTEWGKDTQNKQEDIVAKLQEIIEQIEEQEQQSSGGPSGNQQSQAPAGTSAAPPGAARVGNLNRVNTTADRWGDVRDAERKEIESDVATKLPDHFKKMVGDYYKKLNKGAGR